MTDHRALQAAYEAKRAQATGRQAPTTTEFRVFLPDGVEKIERAAGLAQVASLYPQAWRVERCDISGFW